MVNTPDFAFSFTCALPSGPHLLANAQQTESAVATKAPLGKKPRLRFSRSTTGCRACRVRRVKCPEGALLTDGRRLPCSRCETALEEGGKACWYPLLGKPGQWIPSCTDFVYTLATEQSPASASSGGGSPRDAQSLDPPKESTSDRPAPDIAAAVLDAQTASWWLSREGSVDFLTFLEQAGSATPRTPSLPQEQLAAKVGEAGVAGLLQEDESPLNTSIAEHQEEGDSSAMTVIGVADPSPVSPNAIYRFLFAPAPEAPIRSYNLSSIPTTARDRSAMSYFETKGCNDILASNGRLNWIWACLFPRLQSFLSTTSSPPSMALSRNRDATSTIASYVYHSLLRLSLVHRSNTEVDQEMAAEMAAEAIEQRKAASQSLMCAKVYFQESEWHTEEYLAGFFVNCMADMLESRRFEIPSEILLRRANSRDTAFTASLRDMIAVYMIFIHACAPHSPSNVSALHRANVVSSALDATGEEWMERFFGVSRKMVNMLNTVNRYILDRSVLLRTPGIAPPARRIATLQAERLAIQLGPLWVVDEGWEELGKSQRVQRGTTVLRLALLMIVICELLEAQLDDPRLQEARLTALELVADTPPQEIAGYGWSLSIVAIYTADPRDRQRLFAVLRNAQDWSFGKGFKGADEVIHMCWALYDCDGSYRNGIAPWREVLAAFDRSVYF